jgi:hypothetical protein
MKYVILQPLRDKQASMVARALINEVYGRIGHPERIVTSGGGEFVNSLNAALCNYYYLGITHHVASPYHPASNGQVERLHRDMEAMLHAMTDPDHMRWDEDLLAVEMAFNWTWTRTTGETPFFLVHGRHPRSLVEAVVGVPMERILEAAWKQRLVGGGCFTLRNGRRTDSPAPAGAGGGGTTEPRHRSGGYGDGQVHQRQAGACHQASTAATRAVPGGRGPGRDQAGCAARPLPGGLHHAQRGACGAHDG